VDKWNQYKNALRDMLTKPDGTVDMEDGTGAIVTLPTFPALQKLVKELTDAASGAVAGSQDAASSAAMSASDAARSQAAAAASTEAAKAAEDAALASQGAAAKSEANAAISEYATAVSRNAAATSASSASTSDASARTYADNAGFSASSAQSSSSAASNAANLAQQFANAPVNVQVVPGQYSAFHWSEQARLNAMGSLVYKGAWDASNGTYPSKPALGDFYLISVTGTMGSAKYSVGDMMLYDGDKWDRVDNQQTVTSVQGRTGAITLNWSDLGYTPVQNGGGVNQGTASIKIGWSSDTTNKLKVTVDATDVGEVAMETWSKDQFLGKTSQAADSAKLGGYAPTDFVRLSSVQSSVGTHLGSTFPPGIASISSSGNDRKTPLLITNNNNQYASAVISFVREGFFGAHLGLDIDNVLRYGGWSHGANAWRVVHEGLSNPVFSGYAAANEFRASGANGLRVMQANKAAMWRFDGGSMWLLFTNDGDPGGNFNDKRPFQADWSTGGVTFGHVVTVRGQLNADGISLAGGNGYLYNENNGFTVRAGNGSVGYRYFNFNGNNGDFTVNNGWAYANNFKINSDARLKTNRVFLDPREELENIKKLAACIYEKNGHTEYGFFAQEFEKVYPTMVTQGDGLAGPDTRAITFGELLAPIVAAIQHLDQRLADAGY